MSVSMLEDLRHLDKLAWTAAWTCHARSLDASERHDAAIGAMQLLLAQVAAEGGLPTVLDLLNAGKRAITDETSAAVRDWQTVGSRVYWLDIPVPSDPGDSVPPRIALREVFAALAPRHQESLLRLALHGDQHTAATALGVSYAVMQKRVREARLAFYALWWDGESAPLPPFDRRSQAALATHCSHGHEFTPENTRLRKATNGRGRKRACRQCDKDSEQRRVKP